VDDRELADAIVACGVGESTLGDKGWLYRFDDAGSWSFDDTDDVFIRDWRVAGAMMEKCPNGVRTCFDQLWCAQVWPITDDDDIDADFGRVYKSESLAIAINQACCDALEKRNEQ